MSPTPKAFTIFYFTVLSLIVLGVLFEKQLTALEKKLKKKRAEKRGVSRQQFDEIVKENNRLKRKTAKLEQQIFELQKENFCLSHPGLTVDELPTGWYFNV